MLGQIRTDESPSLPPPEITEKSIFRLYKNLPYFTDEQLESLRLLISELLFENAVIKEHNDMFDDIINYITVNISEDLSVNTCVINIIRLFKEKTGLSPTEYHKKYTISK